MDSDQMIQVPQLNQSDVEGIINQWLKQKHRRLTDSQLEALLETAKGCPLPLFLKLSFDEASRWRSYDNVSDILENTVWKKLNIHFERLESSHGESLVRKSINILFERLEGSHGEILVSHALGYLTAGRHSKRKAFVFQFL